MWKWLAGQKYPVILVILGFILIVAACFEIEDILKLQITRYENPMKIILVIGILFVLASIIIVLFGEDLISRLHSSINRTGNGYTTKLRETSLNILYGKIEDYYDAQEYSSAVVLPSNEFFDDECIKDKKSALGAYMQAKFSGKIEGIQRLVRAELKSLSSAEVEKEDGIFQKSYGVGTCIFLDRPLSSPDRIILASVTEKRVGKGLSTRIPFIFAAVDEIHKIMSDKRLANLFLPIVGSGHGGLKNEVAFFSLLLALSEVLRRPSGHHIKSVNIIVFQADKDAKPCLAQSVAKRILEMAVSMFP